MINRHRVEMKSELIGRTHNTTSIEHNFHSTPDIYTDDNSDWRGPFDLSRVPSKGKIVCAVYNDITSGCWMSLVSPCEVKRLRQSEVMRAKGMEIYYYPVGGFPFCIRQCRCTKKEPLFASFCTLLLFDAARWCSSSSSSESDYKTISKNRKGEERKHFQDCGILTALLCYIISLLGRNPSAMFEAILHKQTLSPFYIWTEILFPSLFFRRQQNK